MKWQEEPDNLPCDRERKKKKEAAIWLHKLRNAISPAMVMADTLDERIRDGLNEARELLSKPPSCCKQEATPTVGIENNESTHSR